MSGIQNIIGETNGDTRGMTLQKFNINYIQTHGCPPSAGVPAESTLAEAYFTFLKSKRDKDGDINVSCLINFLGADGNAETTVKASDQLLLQWVPSDKLGLKKVFKTKQVQFAQKEGDGKEFETVDKSAEEVKQEMEATRRNQGPVKPFAEVYNPDFDTIEEGEGG